MVKNIKLENILLKLNKNQILELATYYKSINTTDTTQVKSRKQSTTVIDNDLEQISNDDEFENAMKDLDW